MEIPDTGAANATRTGADATPPPASLPAPETIGRYRILSLLGEGGMGIVYEAEQAKPQRRVAVKVVRGGAFVDERRLRMFEREANTLARLKHPNIGAIYEAGRTEDGQHFFAMELVRGDALDRFLERRGVPTSADRIRFRLELFRKIADAVHYAHQRGVIHRDLKPSNIIVTDETASDPEEAPEIKILDFGLARITDGDVATATMATEVGVIKGTVPYMSPEQARGAAEEIDVRADVYGLGVLLFEMLSGERPHDFSGKSLVEALRMICEEPPRSLRAAMSGVRRLDPDIETIVGKALEKETDRRYPSAAALSEDVARYLASQPILARPPSVAYQLRKFASRNRAIVGGVAASLVVLVAGAVTSSVLALHEAAARRDLQQVVDFQSGMFRGLDAQRMGADLVEDLARRVSRSAVAGGASAEEASAELAELRRSLGRVNATDAALRLLDGSVLHRAGVAIGERFRGQPLIEARLRATLAATYRELGLLKEAEAQALRARDINVRERGREHLDSILSEVALSWIYERQGRLADAERSAREALRLARGSLGGEHDATLWSLTRLGIALDLQHRFAEALAAYTEALELARRLKGQDDPETLWQLQNIGSLHRRRGFPELGLPFLADAHERFRRTRGEDSRDTLWVQENLALVYLDSGQLAEAERWDEDLVAKRRGLLGEDHQETLLARANLARVLLEQGRLADAEATLRDVLDRQRRVLGAEHFQTLWALETLAEAVARAGRREEAVALFESLLAGRRRSLGEDHPETARALRGLEDAQARSRGGGL